MGKRWSEEEIKLLSSTTDRKELSLKLGRTEGAIKAKIKELGIGYKPTELWTPEELETLRSCKTLKEAVEKINNRTKISIKEKSNRLGIKFEADEKFWSNEDIEFLLNTKDKNKLLERFEGRTWQSIRSKRSKTLAKFKKKVK